MKRIAVALVSVAGLSSAHAGVEIGGFAGLHTFSDSNALGDSDFSQSNSALFGVRVSAGITPMFGIEIEGGVIPTESDGGNVTFDIWDLTIRGNLIITFRADDPSNMILPFVTGGGGIMRVIDVGTTDTSLFNNGDMDPLFFAGVGGKYRAGGGWGVRLDARALLPKKDSGGVTFEFELLAALYREFGGAPAKVEKVEPPKTDEDPDKDGVTGEADKCPAEAEDTDGFQDDDGCPDADNDSDGMPDGSDKCPGEAEDKDNFQDDDGCPEADNDNDGVPDAADKCADQPETKNGFEDEDGCPDELPAKLAQYTGVIAGINFKVNSADLLPTSNKALDKAVAVLTEFKDVRVEIQGHTDDQPLKAGGKFADNDALSQARADAVKEYFVKKGIAADRLDAKGYAGTMPVQDPAGLTGAKLKAARTANRRVEFKLVSPGAEAAPAPKAEEPKAEEKTE